MICYFSFPYKKFFKNKERGDFLGNLQIKDPPIFTEQVHQIEEEEYLTAELENEIKGALLNNEVFLKVLAETIQKTVEAHIGNDVIHVTSKDKEAWSNKDGGNADMLDGYHAVHFATADHGHDGRYYTETEVNTLLNGKAASSHNHDTRYYTETEVNTLLSGKAASNHNHVSLGGWSDTRNIPTTPNDYNGTLKCVGIKTATGLGNSLDGSSLATVFGCRGWRDSSGGYSHEFAFTGNGNIYHRSGATTVWDRAWEKMNMGGNDSSVSAAWEERKLLSTGKYPDNPTSNAKNAKEYEWYYYIKFNNGIMIIGMSKNFDGGNGGNYFYFPLSFINNHYVCVACNGCNVWFSMGRTTKAQINQGDCYVYTKTTSYVKIDGGDAHTKEMQYGEEEKTIEIICIGRWK